MRERSLVAASVAACHKVEPDTVRRRKAFPVANAPRGLRNVRCYVKCEPGVQTARCAPQLRYGSRRARVQIARRAPTIANKGEVRVKRAYVMIVDDDVVERARLARLLRSAGYVVCLASNDDDALELLRAAGRLPDVILASRAARGTWDPFCRTLMKSPALSKIAYFGIAVRDDEFGVFRPGVPIERSFDLRGLVRLLDRVVMPNILPFSHDRRSLSA